METINHFIPRDGNTESLWNAGLSKPQQIIPEHLNRVFDTIIIGAGITGITTALNLQKAGQQCLVIEAGTLGFGTTGGTSAHLNTFFDATYPEIEKDFGADAAKLVTASGKEALSIIKANVDEYQIYKWSRRCALYRSYVIAAKLSHDAYPIGLAYDMQEPYHYFRTHEIKGEKYPLVGGEDHKTGHGDPVEAMNNLEAYVCKYYRVASIDYQWSSQYYVPVDGLPYIGELPGEKNTYCATGFNGNGKCDHWSTQNGIKKSGASNQRIINKFHYPIGTSRWSSLN